MNRFEDPSKVRILLADSDGAMMDAVETAIGKDFAVFEKAYDGRSAIEKMERFSPDLIVVDANLPRMSGFVLLTKIRKVKGQAPFVIMTAEGCGSRHEQYATVSLGAEAFYHKPVRMKRLVETVRKLLGIEAEAEAAVAV